MLGTCCTPPAALTTRPRPAPHSRVQHWLWGAAALQDTPCAHTPVRTRPTAGAAVRAMAQLHLQVAYVGSLSRLQAAVAWCLCTGRTRDSPDRSSSSSCANCSRGTTLYSCSSWSKLLSLHTLLPACLHACCVQTVCVGACGETAMMAIDCGSSVAHDNGAAAHSVAKNSVEGRHASSWHSCR